MLLPNSIQYTNNPIPKSPYTIEGTPAKLATFISINRVKKLSGAYYSRYIAAPTPTGTVRTAVIPITQTVPIRAEKRPASSGNLEG
jgi:hypothetical protein